VPVDLARLTDEQKVAVLHTEGAVYVSAGPGAGKTLTLTSRIAHLLDLGVNPGEIVAITFTNRAAGEMRERIIKMLGGARCTVQISTMHAYCARLIRDSPVAFGLENNRFTIADEDDSKRYCIQAIATVTGRNAADVKKDETSRGVDQVRRRISQEKNQLVLPGDVQMPPRLRDYQIFLSRVYQQYEDILRKVNTVDFDDLIMKVVLGLRKPEVRDAISPRIRYLMVDEYQDTNAAQVEMIKHLGSHHGNVFVVGDLLQSIYGFRFADPSCEKKFFDAFPGAAVYTLQFNFRSTAAIAAVANIVIQGNDNTKIEKKIIATRPLGDLPRLVQRKDPHDEADYIVGEVQSLVRRGKAQWKDCAVMYRTRFQSRALEVAAVNRNIPYRVVGSLGFYSRSIIKDVVAYLRLLFNRQDDASFVRIHNQPRRGIGDVGMQEFCQVAEQHDRPLFKTMRTGIFMPHVREPARSGFRQLNRVFVELVKNNDLTVVGPLVEQVIALTSMKTAAELGKNTKKSEDQKEQLNELVVAAYEFDQDHGTGLKGFLDHVCLMQQSNAQTDENRLLMMTIHAAKGQEYPHVWLAGCCDGLIPMRMRDDPDEPSTIEKRQKHDGEEKRVFYVGITRAKDTLTMTWPTQRQTQGGTVAAEASPLLKDVGAEQMTKVYLPAEYMVDQNEQFDWRDRYKVPYGSDQYGYGDRYRRDRFSRK